jgi:predicted TIM-barrel fold metal-dependent hydrolase
MVLGLGYVDVHHHSFPPAYTDFLAQLNSTPAAWPMQPWSVDIDDHFCEHANISIAMLSYVPGGPSFEKAPEQAKNFTRSCNDWNAGLRDQHPDRYGLFAGVSNLAFPDVALDEIKYAFDVLGADGITLATRYVRNDTSYYLGHESFVPVWDELNARKAVVFVHPVPSGDPTIVNNNLPPPMYDFPHETGRTAMDLISGPANMIQEHAADCKIILSHAGGDLPYLIDRAAGEMSSGPPGVRLNKTRDEIWADARHFYYDTALSTSAMHIAALSTLLGPRNIDHILFGTDFPPGGTEAIGEFTRQLESNMHVEHLRGNAIKLFPRLYGKAK